MPFRISDSQFASFSIESPSVTDRQTDTQTGLRCLLWL